MIVFSFVERLEWCDLGYDQFLPDLFCVNLLDDLLCHSFLFGVVVENCRTVLCSNIGSLPVECRRVVCREKDLENILEGDLFGVEGYLYRFRVSCGPSA